MDHLINNANKITWYIVYIIIICDINLNLLAYKVSITSIFPRCASIQGGTLLSLTVPNLDDKTAASLNHLTVGFQSKISKKENDFFKTVFKWFNNYKLKIILE